MSTSSQGPRPTTPGFVDLLGRALVDEQFRRALYDDRARAIRDYHLTPADLEALDSLSRETLHEHATQFAKGSASTRQIVIKIGGRFSTP